MDCFLLILFHFFNFFSGGVGIFQIFECLGVITIESVIAVGFLFQIFVLSFLCAILQTGVVLLDYQDPRTDYLLRSNHSDIPSEVRFYTKNGIPDIDYPAPNGVHMCIHPQTHFLKWPSEESTWSIYTFRT